HLFCPYSLGASKVQVEVVHSQDRYPVGNRYPILLRIKIPEPWSIHSTTGKGLEIIPTVLSFHESPHLRIEDIRFPAPDRKKFSYTAEPVEVYSGEILVKAVLVVGEDAPIGRHEVEGRLSYQACSDQACLPPTDLPMTISLSVCSKDTPVKALNQGLVLSVTKETGAAAGGKGFFLTLLGIFLGGLALNLTPCVYPLIPITVSYFGGKSDKIGAQKVAHGLIYISGLAVTNSILGVSAALSGGMLGAALQNPWVLVLVAGIMVFLGLSFFGLWEIRIPAGLSRIASRHYGGWFGTFFMGLTLGIVAAPCLGPFVLGLLTYVGQRGDPYLGFLSFFVLSIGMGLPLAVLGVFSGAIEKLPLSGDWMVWIRKLMGWGLMGMAAYMVSPLILHPLGKPGLLAGVAVAGGIHLGWIERTGKGVRGFAYFKRISGIVVVFVGILYLLLSFHEGERVEWMPYDRTVLKKAAEAGTPVILDFYADWCGPCVTMDKEIFRDPTVVRLSRQFVTVRVDLTRRQRFQEEILRRYGVRGVPTVLFLNREGVEEKGLRIESLVGKSEFLDKMRTLARE
ncbi:MAG: cytochrome c biogenesis protein CcdA, partial [Pseudomonadota bacterium]